jgi:hypothetical protein
VNGVALNKSNPGLLVNVLEYWQFNSKGKEIMFSWVTEFLLIPKNVDQIQQLCYPLFQAAWPRCKKQQSLWQIIRSYFDLFIMPSMEVMLQSIVTGVKIVFR